MIFSNDEWPGGHNIAYSPRIWRRILETFDGYVGMNYDPSHLVWQMIDQARFIREFGPQDRKSTRLNSSHSQISYAVFCLKKKKKNKKTINVRERFARAEQRTGSKGYWGGVVETVRRGAGRWTWAGACVTRRWLER